MKKQQTFLIETDKKLCKYDCISYEIYEGQQLIITKDISETTYLAEINTNDENETLNENYAKGVKCYRLFNVLGGEKDDCTNDTSELTLLKIK